MARNKPTDAQQKAKERAKQKAEYHDKMRGRQNHVVETADGGTSMEPEYDAETKKRLESMYPPDTEPAT